MHVRAYDERYGARGIERCASHVGLTSSASRARQESTALRLQGEELGLPPLPPANITIEYGTNGGLFNQQIATLDALLYAVGIKATRLRWTPSQDRSTFAKGAKRQQWRWRDADQFYDMDRARRYFRGTRECATQSLRGYVERTCTRLIRAKVAHARMCARLTTSTGPPAHVCIKSRT